MTEATRLDHYLNARVQFVMFEAGGPAARSMYQFLPMWARSQLIAVDADPAALLYWTQKGVTTMSEAQYCHRHDHVILPVDEFIRDRNGWLSPLSTGPIASVHNKSFCYTVLENAMLRRTRLPRRLNGVVVRQAVSAGSKGLQRFRTDPDTLVTEEVQLIAEYVVDVAWFDKLLIYPRITHLLKHGQDTVCTIIGRDRPHFEDLFHVTREVMDALDMRGLANIQVGLGVDRQWYFFEAAMRLSGASWLNRLAGGNPVWGTPNENLTDKAVSTYPI